MNMQKNGASVIAVICFIGFVICQNVRVTEFRVPSEAILGDSVRLVCHYDLGEEELYVVKWYKDDIEFYRYEPKDHNQSFYFAMPGIDIDLSQSGSNAVFLRNVALDSAGAYKCQVSTDAPTYSCVQAVKEMDIIIMPTADPTITGDEEGYDVGNNVTLNCTSSKSKPAAELHWYINGKHVPEMQTLDHGVIEDSDNLQVTSKSLHLHISERLFLDGQLSINCEANFYGKVAVAAKKFTLPGNSVSSVSRSRTSLLVPLILIALQFILR